MRPSKTLQLALGKPETLPGRGEVAGVGGDLRFCIGSPDRI